MLTDAIIILLIATNANGMAQMVCYNAANFFGLNVFWP
jgi:hypothetical protein